MTAYDTRASVSAWSPVQPFRPQQARTSMKRRHAGLMPWERGRPRPLGLRKGMGGWHPCRGAV
jgi:hypothetical protein